MVKNMISAAVAAVALASLATSADAYSVRTLQARQTTSQGSIQASDYTNGATAPGAMSGDAAGQTIIIDNVGGGDDASQRAGCSTIFIGSADVGGSFTTGWTSMPQVLGFDTMRDLTVSGDVVQPYIVERGKDASKIKRVIITQPGLPRDYWKYANLMRNSLLCASANSSMGIDRDEILIVAPAWVNRQDLSAGSAQANDLIFSGSQWASGADSYGPGKTSVSSFEVLDQMTEKYLNKTAYPNVGQVIIAGHSLGGLMTQHYAMLRKSAGNDPNIHFFVGNPGSYVWPVTTRPVSNPSNTSCAATVDDYQYGLNDLPSYARSEGDRDSIASRYYGRNVVYGLGLADNEIGDTHCEAQYQGTSHLNRGQNFQQTLASANGGTVPSSHIFNYVANVGHEDYLIFADPVSQYHLFSQGFNTSAVAVTSTASATSTRTANASKSTGNNKTKSSASATSTPANASSGATPLGVPASMATAMLAVVAAVAAIAF